MYITPWPTAPNPNHLVQLRNTGSSVRPVNNGMSGSCFTGTRNIPRTGLQTIPPGAERPWVMRIVSHHPWMGRVREPLFPHGMHSSLALLEELGEMGNRNTATILHRYSLKVRCRSGGWQYLSSTRTHEEAKFKNRHLRSTSVPRTRLDTHASRMVS